MENGNASNKLIRFLVVAIVVLAFLAGGVNLLTYEGGGVMAMLLNLFK